MKNVFESMARALREFKDEDTDLIDAEKETAENGVEGEVVKPIVDPELGFESDFNEDDLEGKSYIGKKVIDCHICGTPFFADELTDETVCPVCTATAEDLEVVGVVAKEGADTEPTVDDQPADTEPVAGEESDKGEDKEDDSKEDDKEDDDKFEGVDFDETSMDKLVENFLKENYEDFKSYKTTETTMTGNNKLRVKGVVETAHGIRKNVAFLTEQINLVESGAKKIKASCPAFSGSRENSFMFEGAITDNKLAFNKMSYRYVVKHNNESYQVSGKAII